MAQSFTKKLSYKIFYFNKLLEIAHFSSNHLNNMPKFCQVSDFVKNLLKIETIDMSSNRICSLASYSFNYLISLRNCTLTKMSHLLSLSQMRHFLNLIPYKTFFFVQINFKQQQHKEHKSIFEFTRTKEKSTE